jgi:DNA-directed RNA polymerase subunit K/omega
MAAPPDRKADVIHRPASCNAFEFVTLSSLRAAQLMQGSTPRVAIGIKPTVTAQREVAAGKILQGPRSTPIARA